MRRSEVVMLTILGVLAAAGIVLAAKAVQSSAVVDDRLEEIRAMSAEEKSRLVANLERFEQLSDDEKQRLRQIQLKVDDDANVDELRGVRVRYDQWLSELPYSESVAGRRLPPDQRVERIKKLRERELQTQLERKDRERSLTDRDWQTIRAWWANFVQRNERQLLAKMPQQMREAIGQLPPERRSERLQLYAVMTRKKHARGKLPIKPTPAEVEELVAALSPDVERRLRSISKPDARLAAIGTWVQSDMRRRINRAIAPYVDSKELERFYNEKLSAEQRAKLKDMTERHRRRELAHRYVQWKLKNRKPGDKRPKHQIQPPRRPNDQRKKGLERDKSAPSDKAK